MTKRILILLTVIIALPFFAPAQSNDPILFTVEDTPVRVSEFTYIYDKTNANKADYSKKSIEEYLELYVKFKLKVQKARAMQLDTIPQLKKELEGYRRQLADSYLIDKEVTEKLNKEVYERSKQDVDISHILFKVADNATPEMEKNAYDKAIAAKKRLDAGENFITVVEEMSEDNSAKKNKGHIGYVTALFPNGFYTLETAAYTQKVGSISDPIRTSAGYHLLKVNDRRPARGEIEAAHIFIRSKKHGEEAAKAIIDSLFQELKNGASFETLAQKHSEDKKSAKNGGSIGFFGINKYDKTFENTAFSLKKNGDYSDPIQTAAGWHIIKRISKKDLKPYDIEKNRLRRKVEKDKRFQQAQDAMLARIKKEANLSENKAVLDTYIDGLSDDFTTFKWRVAKDTPTDALLSLDGAQIPLTEFAAYLSSSQRERLRLGRTLKDKRMVAENLYAQFVDSQCMKYEETQLEEKYPEFKALMREYEEGILLFEATKMQVWDKASQDTTGLKKFFKKIRGKYRWEERAVVSEYKISSKYEAQIPEIAAFAATNTAEAVQAKYNTPERTIVLVDEKSYEKTRKPELNSVEWKVGSISKPKKKSPGKFYTFLKINEILPVGDKTLAEARGYVVADYQDELDREWVQKLRKEYKVDIDSNVLKSLIKK